MYSEKTTDLNQVNNKLKNQQYHSVRTVPKSNMNIVEKGKIDTLTRKFRPLTFQTWYMHFNKKKCGGVKPLLLSQTIAPSTTGHVWKPN